MAIDPGFPVFLKKMAVDPLNGNIYPASPTRAYQPGELPRRFLNDEYCSQEGVVVVKEIVMDLRMPNTEPGAQAPAQLRPAVMETRDLNNPVRHPVANAVPVSPTVSSPTVTPTVNLPTVAPTIPLHTPPAVVEATVATGDTVGQTVSNPVESRSGLQTVKINQATGDEIANALNGVGAKTAEKVIQEREARGVFASLEALDTRSPLPFGRKWEDFATQLAFE